jgi:hypothetical protein
MVNSVVDSVVDSMIRFESWPPPPSLLPLPLLPPPLPDAKLQKQSEGP